MFVPELRESEDERIRKAIIYNLSNLNIIYNATKEECLSWLEKQKEQSLRDFIDDFPYSNEKEQKAIPIPPPYWESAIQEQKPAEWREEDENIRKQLISICDEWLNGGYGARPCLNDVRWLKNLLEKQKEQKPVECIPDSIKFDEGFKTGREVGFREGVESVKPAWSEEDKQWLSEVYFAIDHSMYSEAEKQAMKKYIDYLRYQSQPKQEWSEEDERMRQGCIDSVEYELLDNGMDDEVETDPRIAWLKSLRPRPSWKPSEEQMEALENSTALTEEQGAALYSLIQDLKSYSHGSTR